MNFLTDEILVDNGALGIMLTAYEGWLKVTQHTQRLPQLDLTINQQFLVNLAQVFSLFLKRHRRMAVQKRLIHYLLSRRCVNRNFPRWIKVQRTRESKECFWIWKPWQENLAVKRDPQWTPPKDAKFIKSNDLCITVCDEIVNSYYGYQNCKF